MDINEISYNRDTKEEDKKKDYPKNINNKYSKNNSKDILKISNIKIIYCEVRKV